MRSRTWTCVLLCPWILNSLLTIVVRATTTVTVEAGEDLVESDPEIHTGRRSQSVRQAATGECLLIPEFTGYLALPPGVAADSNGLFHGLGDHAENSILHRRAAVINDQQSQVFSNQLPVDAVQSMEVIEGAPPAEYGDKTSLA